MKDLIESVAEGQTTASAGRIEKKVFGADVRAGKTVKGAVTYEQHECSNKTKLDAIERFYEIQESTVDSYFESREYETW